MAVSSENYQIKLKYRPSRKAWMTMMSILFGLVLVVILTIFSTGLDPSQWGSREFLSDLAINSAILIMFMVGGIGLGSDYARNNITGLYNVSYQEYIAKRGEIDPYVGDFNPWADEFYERKLRQMRKDYLISKGIRQADLILDLDRLDAMKLGKPQTLIVNGVEHHFLSLTEEQVEEVGKVFEGKVSMNRLDDQFFLTAFGKAEQGNDYKAAGLAKRRKTERFVASLAFKLVMSFGLTLILTGLVVDSVSGEDTAEIVTKLISRLVTAMTSTSWGFMTGSDLVKDEIPTLVFKTTSLGLFLNEIKSGQFKPKSAEELAKKQIEEAKKAEEEAIKSIVIPDAVITPVIGYAEAPQEQSNLEPIKEE